MINSEIPPISRNTENSSIALSFIGGFAIGLGFGFELPNMLAEDGFAITSEQAQDMLTHFAVGIPVALLPLTNSGVLRRPDVTERMGQAFIVGIFTGIGTGAISEAFRANIPS